MSLDTLSFKIFEDAACTIEFSGTLQVLHNTSLSDNPQDFQFWLGSAEAEDAYILQSTASPGSTQISLTPTATIAEWAVATAYVLGQQVEPTTPNTYYYECSVAGTSDATTEPTWPTTPLGSTVTDGTVTWTLKAKKHPTTEVKLALTSGGLAAAVAGAALDLGTSITSGSANAVEFWVRITNTVATVSDVTAYPQLALYINDVTETVN